MPKPFLVRSKRNYGTSSIPLSRELSKKSLKHYLITSSIATELGIATQCYFGIQKEFTQFVRLIQAGRYPDIQALEQSLGSLVNSVIRNPAASVWLSRLKSKSSYTYRHCVASAILCCVMGRQLGLELSELKQLSLAGLLMDCGKVLLPNTLLRKKEKLSEEELQLAQSHIELGIKSLRKLCLPDTVIDTIKYHHERYDGSGYPEKLEGTHIPLFARIAGIVDSYDAMVSPRFHAAPVPHNEALKKLASFRDTLFQKELVDIFIQAIGLYPPGSLVELTNGEVGVVTNINSGSDRKPEVKIILDASKKRLSRRIVLNLEEAGHNTDIAKTLPPDAYNLDPEALL